MLRLTAEAGLLFFVCGHAWGDSSYSPAAGDRLSAAHRSHTHPAARSDNDRSCAGTIRKLLHFLDKKQVKLDRPALPGGPILFGNADRAGNWPQYVYYAGIPDILVREVSPFMATFIHHALTHIVEENLAALNLQAVYALKARTLRRRAITFMQLFAADTDGPARGAYGFWPHNENLGARDSRLSAWVMEYMQGPVLQGTRTPINIGFYPSQLAIPSDADVTATIFVSLLENALFDNGTVPDTDIGQFFDDWRDTGMVPLRLQPGWLPAASGVYLTWLNYHDPPDYGIPNDIDLVVNANVLYALARYDLLDTQGAADAIDLISEVIRQGIHISHSPEISDYYPFNLSFHYCVSRAYHEGPVPELRSAVELLADELEQSAIVGTDGSVYWDEGCPHLNTAFAVLTLLNAGRESGLLEGAVDYLAAEQDLVSGGFDECLFFIGTSETGLRFNWISAPLTSAMVLEALCRYQLER